MDHPEAIGPTADEKYLLNQLSPELRQSFRERKKRIMNHPEAVRQMAVEKYLLNELSPELRRSFEEHLFECNECEFDIQAGYALIDGSKEALASVAVEVPKAVVPGKQSSWLSWFRPAFAAPVMALLVAVVGYQNLVTVPSLKNEVASAQAPQILNPVYLVADATRDETPVITTKRYHPFSIALDIHADSSFTSYVCELQSESGELQSSLTIPSEATKNAVNLSMYPRDGKAGRYKVVVFGISQNAPEQKRDVGHQIFELRFQD